MKCLEKIIAGILLASVLLQPLGLVTPVLAETVEMEYSDPNHLHAPKIVNGTAYEYDANGNLLNDGERTIEWNQDNKPIRITKGDQVVEFFYDASGRRILKKSFLAGNPDDVDTTTYVSGSYQKSLVNGVETTTKYYFANGRVAVRNTTPSTGEDELTFLHQDHLGSTILATSPDSQPLSDTRLAYFPYGKKTTSDQLPVTNYQFTGQELDPESNLYNYNARLYNPTTGAFISADSVGGGNRYAYAANNPMMFVDPNGKDPVSAVLMALYETFFGSGVSPAYGDLYYFDPTTSKVYNTETMETVDWSSIDPSVLPQIKSVPKEQYLAGSPSTGAAARSVGVRTALVASGQGLAKEIFGSMWYLSNPAARNAQMGAIGGGGIVMLFGMGECWEGNTWGGLARIAIGAVMATSGIMGAMTVYEGDIFKVMQLPGSKDLQLHVNNAGLKEYIPRPGMADEAWDAAFEAMYWDLQQISEFYPEATIRGTTSLRMPPAAEDFATPATGIGSNVLTFFQWINRMLYQMNLSVPYSSVPQLQHYETPPDSGVENYSGL